LETQEVSYNDLGTNLGWSSAPNVSNEVILGNYNTVEEAKLAKNLENRYAGWNEASAQTILTGKSDFESLSSYVLAENTNPKPVSGHQELLERILNDAIIS
jgi:xylose isomerase